MDSNNWGAFAQNIDRYARELGLTEEDVRSAQNAASEAEAAEGERVDAGASNERLSELAERIAGHPNFNEEMADALGLHGGSAGKARPGGGMSGGSMRN
jgi:hypothetical protein